MRNNPANLVWLIIILISVISSLKDKWSKRPNERTKAHSNKHTSNENDMEIVMTKAEHNCKYFQQPEPVISETTETDFGEELNQASFVEESMLIDDDIVAKQVQQELPVQQSNVRKNSRRINARKLRQAIVYHDILSKPKSLR